MIGGMYRLSHLTPMFINDKNSLMRSFRTCSVRCDAALARARQRSPDVDVSCEGPLRPARPTSTDGQQITDIANGNLLRWRLHPGLLCNT